MSDDALCFMTIHELGNRIRSREVSATEVVDAHIRRIEAINSKVLGFLEVTAEMAFEEARSADAEIAKGNYRGPLHGIPYGVKDIIDTASVRTTKGSAMYQDNVPVRDAHCVALLKKAGAILLGKCHTQEFASGPLSLNPFFGTVRNPWDLSRTTGGSSSGSAASVAARMCPMALGTDTGSSIRGPAALCGIVGLKPTHGRVSLSGVAPNALSFDHVGPLTRSAMDAALILQVISGYDDEDPYSNDNPVPNYMTEFSEGLKGKRVGLCPDLYNNAEVDSQVMHSFEKSVNIFHELGAIVNVIRFEHAERFLNVIQTIISAEFLEFHRPIYEKNRDGYGDVTKKAIESRQGTVNLDQYVRAQRERELLRREVSRLFHEVDMIITPSLPCVAPPVDTWKAMINGKEIDYSLSITMPFLTPQNLTGFPAAAVPMGFSSIGMPISLQIIGMPEKEAVILKAAHTFQEHTSEIQSKTPSL